MGFLLEGTVGRMLFCFRIESYGSRGMEWRSELRGVVIERVDRFGDRWCVKDEKVVVKI